MFIKSAVAVALLTSFVAAQTFNSTVDPGNVLPTTKSQWCLSQINVCGTLCSGEINSNECDAPTLVYNCTCASNNSAPGLAYYTGTLPTFVCNQVFENCIAAGENDQAAQAVCTKNKDANCGTLDPDNFTAPADTSSSISPSSTPSTNSPSAAAGTASPTSTPNAAGAISMPGQNIGLGAIVLAAGAAFGYIL
ncbi:hypothetical protein LZ554_005226 [Drepanopeziza brunnea f. sp. 'monogermtubi']|nr:hypothetical protein LZ554_005226 [Drepanopeziza brunnea f. sp. 'monogermtubi']